jgi:small nuclear ribonucleoprotein (snRNP)-like protein
MKKLFVFLLLLIPFVCFAQNKRVKVSLRSGATVEGMVKEFDALDHITIIVGDFETTIPMSQVAYVSNLGEETPQGTESSSKPNLESKEYVKVIVEDPLKDFKGFLLEKGNNVYVNYSNSDEDKNSTYDKEGAMVIRALLKRDGFWNIVDKEINAHFTFHYRVNTHYSDKAQLYIYSFRTDKALFLAQSRTSESESKNNVVARHFYENEIKSLQKKIEKGKVSKKIREDFTIK